MVEICEGLPWTTRGNSRQLESSDSFDFRSVSASLASKSCMPADTVASDASTCRTHSLLYYSMQLVSQDVRNLFNCQQPGV